MALLLTIGWILVVVGLVLFVLSEVGVGPGAGSRGRGWSGGIGLLLIGAALILLSYAVPV